MAPRTTSYGLSDQHRRQYRHRQQRFYFLPLLAVILTCLAAVAAAAEKNVRHQQRAPQQRQRLHIGQRQKHLISDQQSELLLQQQIAAIVTGSHHRRGLPTIGRHDSQEPSQEQSHEQSQPRVAHHTRIGSGGADFSHLRRNRRVLQQGENPPLAAAPQASLVSQTGYVELAGDVPNPERGFTAYMDTVGPGSAVPQGTYSGTGETPLSVSLVLLRVDLSLYCSPEYAVNFPMVSFHLHSTELVPITCVPQLCAFYHLSSC